MVGSAPSRRRTDTRAAILDAARAHAEREGWRRARVSDIARDAGISRPTLYKEFSSKRELGFALLRSEVEAFLHRIEEVIAAAGPGLRNRIGQAMERALTEVDRNPLLVEMLAEGRTGEDGLLPGLTAGQTDVISVATSVVGTFIAADAPDADPTTVEFVATVCVRLTVSFLVEPPSEPPEVTAARVADLCTAYLTGPTR